MPDEIVAAPQPEAPASISGAKSEPGNVSGSQFARMMSQRHRTEQAKTAAPKAEATPPPAEAAPEAAAQPETPEPTGEASATPSAPEEQPEGETPEGDTKGDDVLSQEDQSLDQKTKDRISRRIGKEVAKRKGLERQMEEMRAQLQDVQSRQQPQQPPAATPTPVYTSAPDSPLAAVESMQELENKMIEARAAIREADEYLEQDDFPATGIKIGDQLFTKERIRAIRRDARVLIDEAIPSRARFLQQRQQVQQVAYENFPFLKNQADPLFQKAKAMLNHPNNAFLRGHPAAEYIVGAMIRGEQAIEAEKSAKAKATAKPAQPKIPQAKPPQSQAEVSSGDSSGTDRSNPLSRAQQQMREASDRLKAKNGVSGRDFAAYLSQKEKLRSNIR